MATEEVKIVIKMEGNFLEKINEAIAAMERFKIVAEEAGITFDDKED